MPFLPNARRTSGSGGGRPTPYVSRFGGGSSGFQPNMEQSVEERRAALAEYDAVNRKPKEEKTQGQAAAEQLTRLIRSGDDENKAKGLYLLKEYKDVVTAEDAERYGISEEYAWASEDNRNPVHRFLQDTAEGAAEKVLTNIVKPGQASLELLQAAMVDLGIDAQDDIAGDALKKKGGYRDALRALQGKPRWDPTTGRYITGAQLEFKHALGTEDVGNPVASKILTGASFLGGAAVDPLNLVGGGSGAAAKSVGGTAAKQLAEEGAEALSPVLARQLARQGSEEASEAAIREALVKTGLRRGLTREQRDALRQRLIAEVPESSTTKGIITGKERTVLPKGDTGLRTGFRLLTGRAPREGAERVADERLAAALNYDRGGLRIRGQSLLPSRQGAGRFYGTGRAEAAVAKDQARRIEQLDAKAQGLAERISRSEELIATSDDAVQVQNNARRVDTLTAQFDAVTAEADALRSAGTAQEALAIDAGLGSVTAEIRGREFGKIGNWVDQRVGPVNRTLEELFVPRAGVKQSTSLTGETADLVYQAQSEGRALANEEARRVIRTLESATSKAAKEGLKEEDLARMLDALETASGPEAAAALRAEGRDQAADLARALDDTRRETYLMERQYDLIPEDFLQGADTYLGRYYTDAGQRAMRALQGRAIPGLEQFRKVSGSASATRQGGHTLAREIMPELTNRQFREMFEPIMREHKLLKEGETLLETNPVTIVAKRALETVRAAEAVQTIEKMSSIKGVLGDSQVIRIGRTYAKENPEAAARTAQDATRRGMQKVDLGTAGVVYTHPDLTEPVGRFFALMTDSEEIARVKKFLDDWNRMWKGYATVPLVGGSFHATNSIGNVINNTLRGIPFSKYPEALNLQIAMRKAKKTFPELSIPEAMERTGATNRQLAMVEAGLEEGVIDESFLNTDLGVDEIESATKIVQTRRERAAALVPRPKNADTAFGVRTGRKVSAAVEDNARLAHFIGVFDETGSFKEAGNSVKEFLFDYGDLTEFEQKWMKRINAFYTFTRKNTPLQFRELVNNPARLSRIEMAQRSIFGYNDSGEGADRSFPSYFGAFGLPTGQDQSDLLVGKGGTAVAGLRTPYEAAFDMADPLLLLAGKSTGEDAAASLLRNVSGGPAEALKLLVEERTGQSLFTGASLNTPEGERKVPFPLRALTAINPSVGKIDSLTGRPFSEASTESLRVRAIRAMTGISLAELTDERVDQAERARVQEIRDIIEELNRRSPNSVPTVEELQRIGEVPRKKRAG